MNVKTISAYIKTECGGNKAEFARRFQVRGQHVNRYISENYYIIDGVMWKKTEYKLKGANNE